MDPIEQRFIDRDEEIFLEEEEDMRRRETARSGKPSKPRRTGTQNKKDPETRPKPYLPIPVSVVREIAERK